MSPGGWPTLALAGAVLALALGPAEAQTAGPPPAADVARGATIVAGSVSGLPACASCHGEAGDGRAAEGVPRLAGQSAYYLAKQLRDYRSGARGHALKAQQVAAMTEQDMADVAAHYEQLRAPYPPAPARGAAALARGQALARFGSRSPEVSACDSCHGPQGQGFAPAIPFLAGQHATYIAAQLRRWRSGERRNDEAEVMRMIGERLRPQDIEAVSAYYARQRPLTLTERP
jgi:cytochrome c553